MVVSWRFEISHQLAVGIESEQFAKRPSRLAGIGCDFRSIVDEVGELGRCLTAAAIARLVTAIRN